ncbi:MAG: hypothetical protein RIQ46_2007 [Pseudomonadota bacterium]
MARKPPSPGLFHSGLVPMALAMGEGRDDRNGTVRRRRGQKGPTLADVAREAGVSAMTASRAVNGGEGVLPETRERVLAAVAALGYVPNLAARSLAGGKPCRIALLHSNPSAAYLSEFLMGSMAEADASDAQLVVEHCREGEDPAALVARLAEHRIDAVLLPPPLCDDSALIAAIAAAALPAARIATGQPLAGTIAITIDDEAAAHAMTARLIAQGHRRVGFIAGNPNQTASALRRAGYQRALAEAGIAPDPALVRQGDFTYRSGLVAAEGLLAESQPPSAIFASNDDMAAAAVAVAHRLGLAVPGKVAICGFDDTALATTIWPELTTIRQPVADMARIATARLVGKVRGRRSDGPDHVRLPFTLVSRGSG